MRNMKQIFLAVLLATAASSLWAQDALEPETLEQEQTAEEVSAAEADEQEPNGNGVDSPKTMSGMSILGNEEAPKSLVIVPWKSSRMGDELDLSDTLDDRAQPVDKEVFMREMRFYKIRSGEQT